MLPPFSNRDYLGTTFRRNSKRRTSVGIIATILGLFATQADVSAIDARLLHQKAPMKSDTIGEQPNAIGPMKHPSRPPEVENADSFGFGVFWSPLGPSPIPNGQTLGAPPELPVSGRVTAIAIDPHDSNVVYVAGAQGGVFRTLDGGQTWLELMAVAKNVAIGSIAIDPSDPDDLLVGTGEGNFSADSHFGVGVYVIKHATSSSPQLVGPFRLDASGHDVLSFRSITQIIVSPADHNVVFCATSSAFGGLGAASGPAALRPPRGLYRSTNFFSGSPTFARLTVGPGTDTRVTSAVLDPTNPNHLVCSIYGLRTDSTGANLEGGLYYTNNALAPVPVFTRSTIVGARTVDGNLPLGTNVKLAAATDGKKVVILAATSESALKKNGKEYADQGVVRKSTDGGVSFPTTLPSANGFAGGQGFYNIAIAIDQSDSKNVYLAGTLSSTGVDPDGGKKPIHDDGGLSSGGPSGEVTDPVNGTGPKNGGGTFQYSRNGGATFVPSVKGLHVDSHAIAVAPSAPNDVWTGNDGGVWKSTDSGKTWIDENVFGFVATQFESVALHPTDPNFSIGGTQDNGTEFFQPGRSFVRADFGDGGYALIDQSAKDTENVTMYHTYFNQTGNLIGFGRTTKSSCAKEGQWSFMGIYNPPIDPTLHCDGFKDHFNGISITDNVNFYAPMALGPGQPNSVYFGTDRLYRSSDRGTTMTVVSQAPLAGGDPISAIAISPQNDKIRLVGLDHGHVFGTSTGSSKLIDVTGPILLNYVTRIEIDPTNANVAYVALNGYGLPSGQQIWKTTNLVASLNAGKIPNWAPSSKGIPDFSVNAVVVDPARPSDLYAGTDRGVWVSTDGAASWKRYGVFLPNVEVYDVKVHGKFHILRAATHGLGMWEAPALSLFGPAPSP
jgi:hypothetical protein